MGYISCAVISESYQVIWITKFTEIHQGHHKTQLINISLWLIRFKNMRKLKSHGKSWDLWGNSTFPVEFIKFLCLIYWTICMFERATPIFSHSIEVHPNTNQNNKDEKQQYFFFKTLEIKIPWESVWTYKCFDGLHQLSAIASKSILIPTKIIKMNINNHWCPAEGHAVMTCVILMSIYCQVKRRYYMLYV